MYVHKHGHSNLFSVDWFNRNVKYIKQYIHIKKKKDKEVTLNHCNIICIKILHL